MSRLILFKDTGECGNRLVTYGFLLCFAREYQVATTNLCFWRYARYFERQYSFVEHPWQDTARQDVNRANHQLRCLDDSLEEALRNALETSSLNRFKKYFLFQGDVLCHPQEVLFRGLNSFANRVLQTPGKNLGFSGLQIREELNWNHQCTFLISNKLASKTIFQQSLVEKHAQYLRQSFKPCQPYQSEINSFIASLRENFAVLVGVHVRRGDYSKYRNGKWCFSNQSFRRWMEMIISCLFGRKVVFILASNESLDLSYFHPFNVVKSPGHLIVDMYSLAACDFIIGPPSTFSGWASFVGEAPISFLNDQNQEIDLQSFKVWKPKFF